MKWLSLLLLLVILACSAPPAPLPKPEAPSHMEERYFIGATKDKYVLTIAVYEVHSRTDYRHMLTTQKHFDTYEQMVQEIKTRKDSIK